MLFNRSNHDFIGSTSSPAQVRGEHVELFVFGDDRVEGGTVGPVEHVALSSRPPVQRAGKGKAKVAVKCRRRVQLNWSGLAIQSENTD